MILTCPACSTRYRIGPAAIGAAARKVRCSKCGHKWVQHGEAEVSDFAIDTDSGATQFLQMRTDQVPSSLFSSSSPILMPPPLEPDDLPGDEPARTSRPILSAAVALIILLVGIGGVIVERSELVAMWPPSARLFDAIGLPVLPPGAGLQFQNVRSERRADDGAEVLLVEGQIVNGSDEARSVPMVRADLLAADHKLLKSWNFSAAEARLLPGEITTFHAVTHEVGSVSEVAITFDGGS